MHISARFALTDMMKARGSHDSFTQVAVELSHQGLPLPIIEEERILLERAVALMRATLDVLGPLC
ncbi:ELFV_dehydrog domain-containing protein [Pseudomonas zeae]